MLTRRWWVCLALAGLALPFIFALAMGKALNHDEHQHIAAGALLGRDGLLPYRDYPYFHMPYLAAIYAALFALGDHLLWIARMVSVVSAAAFLGLLGWVAYEEFRERGRRVAGPLALAIVVLGGSASVFIQATGRAWNNEPALLLAVLATCFLLRGWKRSDPRWFALAGVTLGLCIGVRLTYAPLIAPFGLVALRGSGFSWRRWAPAAAFSAGLLLSLVPAAILCALDPEAFLFGNWEFARVNVDFRLATGSPNTMTFGRKLRFFWKDILRFDLPLLLAVVIPWIAAWRARGILRPEGRILLLLLPFVLLGALVPSPAYRQYFYPLVPFGLAAAIYGLASLPKTGLPWKTAFWSVLVCATFSLLWNARHYEYVQDLFTPKVWVPMKVHTRALTLRENVPAGTILTLTPTHPLEAGLDIDPSFATGPFAWRISAFVDPAKAQRLDLVTLPTLEAHLAARPPAGVLVGIGDKLVGRFVEYAKQRGATSIRFRKDQDLWILPAAAATRESLE